VLVPVILRDLERQEAKSNFWSTLIITHQSFDLLVTKFVTLTLWGRAVILENQTYLPMLREGAQRPLNFWGPY